MDPESVRTGTARSKGGGISVSAFFFSTWVACLGPKIAFIFRLVFLMVSLKLFGVFFHPTWSLKRIGCRYFPLSKNDCFLIGLSLLLEGLFGALILENEGLVGARRSFSQNHFLAFGQDF